MIAALTGEISRISEDRIYLQAGPILYELLFPAADQEALRASQGRQITLYTLFYLAGDPSRGGIDPTLIAFLRAEDKRFFELFTTVKGIGPKRALRALAVSVSEIAGAIEARDAKFLVGLPEIGKRTAEQIVAELSGKLGAFVVAGSVAKSAATRASRGSEIEEDAIAGLMALGERRVDAENLLERARQSGQPINSADLLLREMLRLRTTRS